MKPMEWLLGDDTGISSKTIFSVMTGTPCAWTGTPLDPSDFGRCYRLLALFPEWRDRMHEVSAAYPAWTRLVESWGELTALYEQEKDQNNAPLTYALMKRLREPVR